MRSAIKLRTLVGSRGFSSSVVKEPSSNPVDDPSARLEFSISCRIHCATVNIKVAGPGQQAVIDNFSRRILAWKVSETFDPTATAGLLLEASKGLLGEKPTVLTDGGVENFNSAVDELIETGLLKRLLAMTEITYSNSMIESWWRALKHQWLYLNTLDTVSTIENLVTFYVDEHNTQLPHSAFRGQTPDEMYFGTGNDIPAELEATRKSARQSRMEVNRNTTCRTCQPLTSIAG